MVGVRRFLFLPADFAGELFDLVAVLLPLLLLHDYQLVAGFDVDLGPLLPNIFVSFLLHFVCGADRKHSNIKVVLVLLPGIQLIQVIGQEVDLHIEELESLKQFSGTDILLLNLCHALGNLAEINGLLGGVHGFHWVFILDLPNIFLFLLLFLSLFLLLFFRLSLDLSCFLLFPLFLLRSFLLCLLSFNLLCLFISDLFDSGFFFLLFSLFLLWSLRFLVLLRGHSGCVFGLVLLGFESPFLWSWHLPTRIIILVLKYMPEPLKAVLKLIEFLHLEDKLLDVILTDISVAVNVLVVNLLVKALVVVRVVDFVAKAHVGGVNDIAPESTNHDAVSSTSFLATLDEGTHCAVRNGSICQPGLEGHTCEAELTILQLIDMFRKVFDAEVVVPVNQVTSEIVTLAEVRAETCVSQLLDVERMVGEPGTYDILDFVPILEFNRFKIDQASENRLASFIVGNELDELRHDVIQVLRGPVPEQRVSEEIQENLLSFTDAHARFAKEGQK